MKVLHVLNELRPSGAEVMLKLAAPYWCQGGIDLTVMSTGSVVGPYGDQLKNAGFKVLHLPFEKRFGFFIALLRIFRGFDIIHIHTERGSFEYSLIARVAGVKKIFRTIHSCFTFKGSTHFNRLFKRWLCSLLGVRCISVGQSVYINELKRFYNKTHVIANWFDDSRFRPPTHEERFTARATLKLEAFQWSVLTVGNCGTVKNHVAVLRALSQLPEAIYIHVGLEDEHREEKVLAEQIGVLDRVRFLGFADPVPWLWAADVYVMPSIHEGFSIAAIEAIATGLPSVLSDVPGLRDLRNLVPNTLFVEAQPDALAKALCKAQKLPRLDSTHELSEKYGVKRGAQAYEDIWRS